MQDLIAILSALRKIRTSLAAAVAAALTLALAATPALADPGEFGRPDSGSSGPQKSKQLPRAGSSQTPAPGPNQPTQPTTPVNPITPVDGVTPAEGALYKDGHAGRFLLENGWYFRADPLDVGVAQLFPNQVTLDGWQQIARVPHAWNAGDDSVESFNGSVGWYRVDFKLPPGADESATWRFRFESVNQRATVFLNGQRIGGHDGPYVPFEIAAKDILKSKVNRLVVRVDNRRDAYDIPSGGNRGVGRFRGGWWNYGGLLREVYLRRVDDVDVQRFTAVPDLDCRSCKAVVNLTAAVRNDGTKSRRAKVRFRVGGQRVDSGAATVGPGVTTNLGAQVKIDRPKLWQPGSPNLYATKASALWTEKKDSDDDNGGGRERFNNTGTTFKATVGIRSIEVNKYGQMELNEQPVNLRGASMHEEDPSAGAALNSGNRKRAISLLKELNANVTRAHYPLHPETLELADRAGILVWDEVPFYVVPDKSLQRDTVRQKGLNYLRQTIERDQSHASVFAYSVANELPEVQSAGQRRYLVDAAKLVKQLDPSRLSAVAVTGYPITPYDPVYRNFDALGINTYFGWYNGPVGTTAKRSLLVPYLDHVRSNYKKQALFVTEFGAEANRNGPATEKGTEEFQASWMRSTVKNIGSRDYINGAIVWILRDFKVRPNWDGGNPKPSPPYNFKGLITKDGRKKPAFADTAAAFKKVAPLKKKGTKPKPIKKPKPPDTPTGPAPPPDDGQG